MINFLQVPPVEPQPGFMHGKMGRWVIGDVELVLLGIMLPTEAPRD